MIRILRVGICACSTRYNGQFEGKTITLKSIRGQLLPKPLTFRLREIHIPERYYPSRKALRDSACHFFIDLHGRPSNWTASISRIEILGKTYRFLYINRISDWDNQIESVSARPATARQFLAWAATLAEAMPATKLYRWINQTPLAKIPKSKKGVSCQISANS